MSDLLFTILERVWKRKDLRPHAANALLTIVIALIAFFYINFRHDEAMGAIREQKGVSTQILEEIRHVSTRIDDLYRLVLDKN